nr:hypothetical protein [Candidatus Sigynarchaeota archaeon]
MNEQISWNAVSAIIGVIVGFVLYEVAEWWKNKRKKNIIKQALLNELAVIRDTFSESLDKTDNKGLCNIPPHKFPFITETYDSIKVELASVLKPSQLAAIQRIYHEIKKLNSPRNETVKGYSRSVGTKDYLYFKDDIQELFELVERIINELERNFYSIKRC